MHREISHTDAVFDQESRLPLYLITGLVGIFMVLDLVPMTARWAGVAAPAFWPTAVGPYRFALIAAILGGARVVYGALQGLFEGRVGADLALAIACLAAILINEPLVAAEVVFIGMLGECLEAFTFARTQNAVRKIVEVFPRRCWRLQDGQEVRVFTHELEVGDRVVVKPGGKIPVDGVVLDGRSAVDTSALTGESLPLDRMPGDEVLAGSINQFGALTIEARQVAGQTVAGRVIELTARALREKAGIERSADRMARYFLPVVLGLAALTFVACMLHFGAGLFRGPSAPRLGLRQALISSAYPTLAVLVVACPCPLILATPAAIIAALGRLAGTGVLIKGGAALERLATVRAFAFDKTGTITEARLELGDVIPLADTSTSELLRLAASAEQGSEHPLARVLLQEAKSRALELDPVLEFQAQPGAGVVARSTVGSLLVGNARLMTERGQAFTPEAARALERIDAAGQTGLLVACNGRLLGVLGVRDRVRPEIAGVLDELRRLGIDPIVLLTGDRLAAAREAARDLGFSAIHAELLPQQKAEEIARLRSSSGSVAMVGDGVNDAPALAGADVGLALGGSGTDIAAEAGDIVLMGDPLRPLPRLVRLSRETVRIIRQNIFVFAIGVNVVGVVLTAWLWPLFTPESWYTQSPLAAVIYHQIGSLAVLLNSMRLLWFDRTASPLWRRLELRLHDADRWFARALDVHELSHRLEHGWRWLLAGLAAFLLLAYAASGLTIVAPDEVTVVRRFGRPVADLAPGWHWRWPWPVEEATRVSQQVQTVSVGFREAPRVNLQPAALTWSSGHMRESRIPDEAMMMTGDGNLVDVLLTVRYRVAQPRVFLFEVADGPETLRSATEATLRTLVASRPFLNLLSVDRGRLQRDLRDRLIAHLETLGPGGLGIDIDGVSILDLHPPGEVVPSYDEVARAMEQRLQSLNEGQERAVAKLKTAEAESTKIIAQARAARQEKIQQADADRTRFLARHTPRQTLDLGRELTLLGSAIAQVQAGKSAEEAVHSWERERAELLARQAQLSDFRLYWDALALALKGRDIILIDSETERLRAQRNLLLFDPDLLRAPVPLMQPRLRPRVPMQPGEDEGP